MPGFSSDRGSAVPGPTGPAGTQFTYGTGGTFTKNSNFSGTTGLSTPVMTGLGVLFTPQTTGKTIVVLDGSIENLAGTVATTGIMFGMSYGPTGGSPPAAMSALTGQALGATQQSEAGATITAADWWEGYSLTRFVQLVPGTQYWFDIFNLDTTASAAGKCAFVNPQWTIFELP